MNKLNLWNIIRVYEYEYPDMILYIRNLYICRVFKI